LKNKSKNIFFITSNFYLRDYKRFGFELLRKRGYNPKVCDVSFLNNSDLFKGYRSNDFIKFNNFKQLVNFLGSLNNTDIVLTIIGPNEKTDFIFKYLNKNNINWGYMFLGGHPSNFNLVERLENSFSNLKRKIKTNPLSLLSIIYNKINRNNYLNNYIPKFVLVAGENIKKNFPFPINDKTNIISIHSFDYDSFLEYKKIKFNHNISCPFVLFMDQNIPYHSDYKRHDLEPFSKAPIYFEELNTFFDFYEKNNNPIKVVILAHPKSDYKNNNPYNGRKIIYGDSPIYIRESELIFAHTSTVISFAMLFLKPILFINSNNYSTRFKNEIKMFSRYISAQSINISKKYSFMKPKIKKESYKKYIHQYIKEKNTDDKFIWEKFCNEIES
jgi:hypothetical protein